MWVCACLYFFFLIDYRVDGEFVISLLSLLRILLAQRLIPLPCFKVGWEWPRDDTPRRTVGGYARARNPDRSGEDNYSVL